MKTKVVSGYIYINIAYVNKTSNYVYVIVFVYTYTHTNTTQHISWESYSVLQTTCCLGGVTDLLKLLIYFITYTGRCMP